jgi:hypothetical protein
MTRVAAAFLLCALIALAGCGDDGDSDSSAKTEAGQGAKQKKTDLTTLKQKQGSGTTEERSTDGGTGQAKKIEDAGGAKTPPGAKPADPKEFKVPAGGDDSIQTYGTAAKESEEEDIIAAMRSFFVGIAEADYSAICAGLTKATREQLQSFLKAKKQEGGCAAVLESLLVRQAAPEARKAAEGAVYQVRVEDETAFVLITPAGGKASYFVMKREGDEWRATELSTGTPLVPIP